MSILDETVGPISIHTLHTEGDGRNWKNKLVIVPFQSTPSTRRVTSDRFGLLYFPIISIHTLHTEGDFFEIFSRNFY